MRVIGVTGGIGSGKSTLCSLLVEHASAALYVADERARELMSSDSLIRREIVEAFGKECYCSSGLNRAFLAGAVFGNPERLLLLNSIVHPRVRADFKGWLEGCDCDIAILESAILFESGFDDLVDISVAILAPKPLRIERVCRRDGYTPEQVESRIEAQYSDDELEKRAHLCVVNIFEDDLAASAQRIVQIAQQWQR